MAPANFSPMKLQAPSAARLGSEVLVKPTSRFACARSVFFSAGALLGLLTLGGCGGGGGGGGGNPDGIAPVAFIYPALKDATTTDTVDGFISPYVLNNTDPTTPSLVSVDTSVFGTSPSSGKITISVGNIKDKQSAAVIEPGFVFTFDAASGSPLLSGTSPLDNLSPGCVGCLKKTVNVPATYLVGGASAGDVTLIYLDPNSATFLLTYSTLGLWSKPNMSATTSATWPEVGGAFSAGVLTRGIDLPTTGSADYKGYFIGRYATSDITAGMPPRGTYIVGANAQSHVEFSGAGAVTFSTSNTQISKEGSLGSLGAPSLEPRLDLSTTVPMTITGTSTSNGFGGTVTTSIGLSGPIQGAFYGPPATTAPFAPPEAGGSLSVTNGSTQSMVGSFALKKQ